MKNVVIVTGGSRGIGAAIARLATSQGYAVCISCRTKREEAEKVAGAIRKQGGETNAVQSDVAVEGEVVALFDEVDAALGQIAALANSAGILERQARIDAIDAVWVRCVFDANWRRHDQA